MSNKPTHSAYIVIDPPDARSRRRLVAQRRQRVRPGGPVRDQPLGPHRLPQAQGATGRLTSSPAGISPAGFFFSTTGDLSHAPLAQCIMRSWKPRRQVRERRRFAEDRFRSGSSVRSSATVHRAVTDGYPQKARLRCIEPQDQVKG